MENSNFNHWAIIEVFGHEKYAGQVTTEQVGGSSMLRLTVPDIDKGDISLPGFTKFINHTSVFSITPVTEEYAIEMAKSLNKQPVSGYEHQRVITSMAQRHVNQMKLEEVKKLIANGLPEPGDQNDVPDNSYSF